MATLVGSASLTRVGMKHGAQLGWHEFGAIAIWDQRPARASHGAAAAAAAVRAIQCRHMLLSLRQGSNSKPESTDPHRLRACREHETGAHLS